MPPEQKHSEKAARNEQLAASIDASAENLNETVVFCRGWAAVIVFYAALHHVDAYLVARGRPASNHNERFDAIKSDPKIRFILQQYRYLSSLSQTVRYGTLNFPPNAYSEATPYLEAVKSQLKHALQVT